MKIGVYGGSFNPPHLGHQNAAVEAAEKCALDKLLLIPAGIPPHKVMEQGSPANEHRLAMTRLMGGQAALQSGVEVEVLDLEMAREGKSYTVDTLRALRRQYPNDELLLFMGTDMFFSFESWRAPEEIAKLAKVVAFYRNADDSAAAFAAQAERLRARFGGSFEALALDRVIEVSSTALRAGMASGTSEAMLEPQVYGYILREHLYGTNLDLKRLTVQQLRPIALSYLKAKRCAHVLGTAATAVKLAEKYGADVHRAEVAGLLHDCTKKLSMPEQLALCEKYGIALDELEKKALKLLHAKTGAAIAREIADITIASEDLFELVTLRRLSEALMARIHRNYRFIVGFNLMLILLGVGGIIQPTTSALLHNMSTLGISLKSMTDLLPEKAEEE